MSSLSPDEIDRYARHLVLPEIGGAGQQKLKAARVLVMGAGGLGSPVLAYLAAAGVGHIRIVDDDTVSLSNLQRQVLHGTAQIERLKVESAAAAVVALNPHVGVETVRERLTPDNADRLLEGVTVAVDGSDNFAARYALSDACGEASLPLVLAVAQRFDGSVTTLMPGGPTFRDLFPEAPEPGMVPSCAEAGIVGALTGILGTIQAMETIKLICGIGTPLAGRWLMIDTLAMRFEEVNY